MLPYEPEAERYVLGAMLWSKRDLAEGIRLLKADDFGDLRNKEIFRAARAMFLSSRAVAPILVLDQLRQDGSLASSGIDGFFVSGLLHDAGASLDFHDHVELVLNRSYARRLEAVMAEDPHGMSNEQIEEATSTAQDLLRRLRDVKSTDTADYVPSYLSGDLEALEALERAGELPGISSGFVELDDAIHGFKMGDLVTVGGATSMGKSALMQRFALEAARQDLRVLFFSLEMTSAECRQRMLAQEANVVLNRLIRKNLTDEDWPRVSEAAGRIANFKLMFFEERGRTTEDIATAVRHVAARDGKVDMVIVDYLQLVVPRDRSVMRYEQVGGIAWDLKSLAGEMACPVIIGCQLSRGLESRENKRPRRSDLKESGDIENHSDTVLLLYRPGVYDSMVPSWEAEIIVAKNRHGADNQGIKLRYVADRTLFTERVTGNF